MNTFSLITHTYTLIHTQTHMHARKCIRKTENKSDSMKIYRMEKYRSSGDNIIY